MPSEHSNVLEYAPLAPQRGIIHWLAPMLAGTVAGVLLPLADLLISPAAMLLGFLVGVLSATFWPRHNYCAALLGTCFTLLGFAAMSVFHDWRAGWPQLEHSPAGLWSMLGIIFVILLLFGQFGAYVGAKIVRRASVTSRPSDPKKVAE